MSKFLDETLAELEKAKSLGRVSSFISGLIKLATALDEEGLHQEAAEIDGILEDITKQPEPKKSKEDMLAKAIGLA